MKSYNNFTKQGLYNPIFEHDACGVGFIANIKGKKSNNILAKGLQLLQNLAHRGGNGAEKNTGDGAGILVQIPDQFFREELSINLPPAGEYGVGMIFLPHDRTLREQLESTINEIVRNEQLKVLEWRVVPINYQSLGKTALESMPFIKQVFIGRTAKINNNETFTRKLYIINRQIEKNLASNCYIASLSSSTVVYKGMLTANQLDDFYLDLKSTNFKTALALVHSRFSTNTMPSWERAHPNRYIAHNGEINTLRGNINWMNARQNLLKSPFFEQELTKVLPILQQDGSDSAMFDNCLEFLVQNGYSMSHALMMMIPEAWQKNEQMSDKLRAFYEYHSCLMEPWDGPAAIAFTNGKQIGAILDRNGLRPSRYYVTNDDLVIMASEAGVLEIPPQKIIEKGRLKPGKMLLVDTDNKKIITDQEVKDKLANTKPYRKWLNENILDIKQLPSHYSQIHEIPDDLTTRQLLFGYTFEDLREILTPMAQKSAEPIGSMGSDTPLAVLSERPQLLYNYFKQLFAQVTNPPIDAIRENIVIATDSVLGSEGNMLITDKNNCRHIKIENPIVTNGELSKLKYIDQQGYQSTVLSISFTKGKLKSSLEQLFIEADKAIAAGTNLIILSDHLADKNQIPIPALLAVAGLHHHLILQGTRTKVSIILESGEPRETHHFAMLLGYGADCINPYLAYESILQLVNTNKLKNLKYSQGIENYRKAALKGIVKIMSKMGISTLQSYRGSQIFEAIGLNNNLINKFFTGTASRIEGIDLKEIAQEAIFRQQRAFNNPDNTLDTGGEYRWRKNEEEHLYSPMVIHKLQQACRTNDYNLYKEYTSILANETSKPQTLRQLLEFNFSKEPLPLNEVESVDSIVKRFKTGAMSFGSVSKEVHECLAIAMNRLGGKSNSGEGGEDPERFTPDENGDSRCSAIKQVASGRFGVTSEYLLNSQELQIKMAQGAKPGEGGQLPGEKVYPWIAKVRHSTPGVGLISPPPHHDIYSIEDLAQLIHDLKNANQKARINVKLVSAVGVGTIAAGVVKGKADVILISGYDGGTGASPRSSIRHTGLPWELGLAETQQTLILNNLRDRVTLETDGKLMTGRDVAVAALLGAEEFGFATAPLVTLGCIMMRVCHLDTCPMGIATQNPKLRKNFKGKPDYVVNLLKFIAQDLREIMAKLGFENLNQMVGQVEKLSFKKNNHWKARHLDLSNILYKPTNKIKQPSYSQNHHPNGIDNCLDDKVLIPLCQPALENQKQITKQMKINNTNRVVGTMLGSKITELYGAKGLPSDTINLSFIGSAGQSFGAFIPPGLTLNLIGDSNDYLGKGLSGGKIIVSPHPNSSFQPENNIIVGNVALYGATSGEAYINGIAGERFCVRNSGVKAVVEGLGDHGCEYMTGGLVVILGKIGRNFAAGMSGGIAYIFDENQEIKTNCNREMVFLENPGMDDLAELHLLIKNHLYYTKSDVAKSILNKWSNLQTSFIKIIPKEYKQILAAKEEEKWEKQLAF